MNITRTSGGPGAIVIAWAAWAGPAAIVIAWAGPAAIVTRGQRDARGPGHDHYERRQETPTTLIAIGPGESLPGHRALLPGPVREREENI